MRTYLPIISLLHIMNTPHFSIYIAPVYNYNYVCIYKYYMYVCAACSLGKVPALLEIFVPEKDIFLFLA